MLGKHPVDVMLLATDLGVARRFYGDTLGLQVLLEDEQFLTFGCGGDSRLVVTKSTTGPGEEATKASRFRISPSWAPSTVWPTSASRWRPGSSTRMTTGSACSSSRIPVCGPTAPQPAPRRPRSSPRRLTFDVRESWDARIAWQGDLPPSP
jgi:hypothetical protein